MFAPWNICVTQDAKWTSTGDSAGFPKNWSQLPWTE